MTLLFVHTQDKIPKVVTRVIGKAQTDLEQTGSLKLCYNFVNMSRITSPRNMRCIENPKTVL
jgi:hypothetical protein